MGALRHRRNGMAGWGCKGRDRQACWLVVALPAVSAVKQIEHLFEKVKSRKKLIGNFRYSQ
jgi:hypothetical protein